MAEKFMPSAKVVDGILILSLPDALSPVVWQMEMAQSKSSALEVRAENDNEFALMLKTPRQDVLEIARYGKREGAIRALLAVSSAMEKSHGHIRSGNETGAGGQQRHTYDYRVPALVARSRHDGAGALRTWVLKPLAYMVAGLVLLGLLFVVGNLFISGFTGGNGVTATADTAPGEVQNEPVSAEDFLKGR